MCTSSIICGDQVMDLTCGGTHWYQFPNIIELKKFHMILTGLTIHPSRREWKPPREIKFQLELVLCDYSLIGPHCTRVPRDDVDEE